MTLQQHYHPREGDIITVTLPAERTRCQIITVVNDEAVIAMILGFTTSPGHQLKKGDRIACRFRLGPMNEPQWIYVPQTELDAEIAARDEKPEVIIESRLHEADEAGAIIDNGEAFEHLKLPMEYNDASG
jgi:hypothetical protein